MTSRKFYLVGFLAVLVAWFACPSLCYAYLFPLNWNDYNNANYGRAHYISTKVFLAICHDRGVTLSVDDATLLSGYSGGLTLTKGSLNWPIDPPYSNNYINKYLLLWPFFQDGNVVTCKYQLLITGFVQGTTIPDYDVVGGAKHRYVWCDVGECEITNFFTTVDNVTINDHQNFFPMALPSSALSPPSFVWMAPSLKEFSINYDTSYNNVLAGQRLRNGSIAELVNMWVNCSYIFRSQTYYAAYTFDFLSGQLVPSSNWPGAFALLQDASTTSNRFSTTNILNWDTDAGSEPDLHEFYAVHIYTYPEDDWVYSGEDYPSGGGSGAGGEITSYGPQAQQTMTETTENALENYFGDDDIVTSPTLPSVDYDEDLDDPDTTSEDAKGFLETAKTELEDDIIDAAPGVAKFKRLIEALKTPGSGRLPTWDLSLESNVLPNMSVFHGAQAQIDLNVLLESPYRSYVVMLRKIVVFLMFGNLVTYIIMDMFGIGKGAGDAE